MRVSQGSWKLMVLLTVITKLHIPQGIGPASSQSREEKQVSACAGLP